MIIKHEIINYEIKQTLNVGLHLRNPDVYSAGNPSDILFQYGNSKTSFQLHFWKWMVDQTENVDRLWKCLALCMSPTFRKGVHFSNENAFLYICSFMILRMACQFKWENITFFKFDEKSASNVYWIIIGVFWVRSKFIYTGNLKKHVVQVRLEDF